MDEATNGDRDGKEDDGENPATTQCGVFYCDVCGDTFPTAAHLDQHSQTSHKEKREGKHQCSYCPYTSYNKTNITRHEWTHTGECPFACDICQKAFRRADGLKAHMRTHAAEKPFECSECSQRFYGSPNLRRHKKLAHSEDARKHACPYCDKTYSQKVNLQNHLPTHTGKRLYQCSQCHQSFTQLARVKKHQRKVHMAAPTAARSSPTTSS
ncbi:zinc finger protein 2-like [Rhipicephalus sanguineus]|uniref:zinc finger protein 2-like n=1 Tax=Rhipicephalus sanguineus TaxID=34632 RepID=UPI001895BBA9|nr:zinc finger protein 2-like [Rhipicephalus sanguineus]